MSRIHVYVLAAFLALPAAAQSSGACNLTISTVCPASGGSTTCTATTINAGTTACTGTFYSGIWATTAGVTVTSPHNSLGLGQCFDSTMLPTTTQAAYAFCFGDTSLPSGASFTSSATVTGSGAIFGVTMVFNAAGATEALVYALANAAGPTCTPNVSAPPVAVPGTDYTVSWTAVSDPTAQYLVDESTAQDFSANFVETQVNGLSKTFNHTAGTYYYRVKATNCAAGSPSFSGTARTIVNQAGKNEAAVPAGTTQPVSITVTLPGNGNTQTFTASTDKSYLSVSPSSGTLPPNGTNVTVTAQPGSLPPGTNTGTLTVSTNQSGTTNTPIAISIVTPVEPAAKDLPPPNALVIPIVTHVNAAAGPFLSDVRLTNAGSQPTNYLVSIAPSSDPTAQSQATTITVAPQSTAALNDIVKNYFGYGATGAATDTGFGALQIRPVDATSALNFASSRTYTTQSIGTFGQYIAAIPFSKFATQLTSPIQIPGQPPSQGHVTTKLSLQQVSVGSRFRTNYGIAEGAGQAASGIVRVFDDNGALVTSTPFNLNPGQVQQQSLGSLVPSLSDGRIEVEITSPTGAVTAYASVLDNGTTDPFAVAPVDVSTVSSTRYVLPGIAEFTNATSNFHSDARIFNGGSSDVTATLSFYPIAGLPSANSKTLTIAAGHVAALDNILPQFFGVSGTGGSVVVTTSSPSSLVATANTYSNSPKGTFGQFIPGVTPADGVGLGDRALQILQLEQSDQFRSNLGLNELTGNPVKVEISLYEPDSKVTPVYDVDLNPNEFKQLNSVIKSFLGENGQAYNARISVRVIDGTGRVGAYGSVIDNRSTDPTYVPQQ